MNTTFHLSEIDKIVKQVLDIYPAFKKFALYGDLGAGKTTLISAMCKHLGVTESTSSPTFVIVQEYIGSINKQDITICHMDWYRLKNINDLQSAGVLDYLHNENMYCFIEWPNNVPDAIDSSVLKIELSMVNELERKIVVSIC